MENILRGLLGMAAIIAVSYLLSKNKKAINWKLVVTGLSIQFILAVFILKAEPLTNFWAPLGWPMRLFEVIASFFVVVLQYTTAGAEFLFGFLAHGPEYEDSMGVIFAFQVLPTIIFFASLTSILYHYGILQAVVRFLSKGMQKLLGTSGAETLSVISNIF
ncbi:MAG: NupC/NupG family nucleoside CNT transporter, partial [Balneolales bacterium]|nr:NupC/NupG family nucleoside CNT transporter [Balneolales bacterium]